MLARPYLMTLYAIFPFHLNFLIRTRCVLKAIIHIKNSGLCYGYLWKFFLFQKDAFYVIVHACGTWLIYPFYHNLFPFFIFLYLSFTYYLNIWKNLLFFWLNKKLVNKKRSCCWSITWLDMYLVILSLLSSCYLILLSNQNQSVYLFLFHIPTKFMINKDKDISQW